MADFILLVNGTIMAVQNMVRLVRAVTLYAESD
jgi:hypothetical protein